MEKNYIPIKDNKNRCAPALGVPLLPTPIMCSYIIKYSST